MQNPKNKGFPIFSFASLSDRGLARDNNEDALICLPAEGCFAIADGMGGGEAGEIASAMVVEAIGRAISGFAHESPGERKYTLQQALHKVHGQIVSYMAKHRFTAMGSTLALLLFDSWDSGRALICHVGDSRAYCLRGDELFRITNDHNVMTEISMRRRGSADQLKNGPWRNVLTRVIGSSQTLFPEWTPFAVCRGDVLLLCSDGVTAMIPDEALKAILSRSASPETIVDSLKKAVYDAGAKDNFSVICLIVNRLPPPFAPAPEELVESNLLLKVSEERIEYGIR